MQIGHDDCGLGVVKPREVGGDATEGVVRRLGCQIADVLADENLSVHRKGNGVLEVRADSQDGLGVES